MSADPIIVSGAASGIGAALAAQLQSAGRSVVGLDIASGPHVSHRVDLSDPVSIDRVCAKLPAALGGIANVAGLPGTHPPSCILAVNALAPLRLIEGLHTRLCADAAIVNVSSVTADRCERSDAELARLVSKDWDEATAELKAWELDGKAAYELSKKALIAASLRMAARLRGVRINIVSPGTVDTPILDDFRQSIGADHIARAAKATGGHGRAEDIASVIAFLLSPESRWVSAAVVKVDGGLHGLRAGRAIEAELQRARKAVPCR